MNVLNIILLLGCIYIVKCQRVDVNTGRGPLFGFHFDQGSNTSALYYGQADVFYGIPFAQPPVRYAVRLSSFWRKIA